MPTFDTLFPIPSGGRNADDMGMPTPLAVPERHIVPIARMSKSEEAWMLRNPYALRLLMDYQDQQFSECEAMGEPGDCGRWPTARWTALYERGRSILAEDIDIWPADLLRDFGFPEPAARQVNSE